VSLLLNGGAELHELFWNGLLGSAENVDQPEFVLARVFLHKVEEVNLRARVSLVLDCEEGNCLAGLSSTASTADTVDVVLNREREL
jgi:hypothetical protein